MTRAEIIERRDEIVARTGPWRRHDVRLADGVHTLGDEVGSEIAHVRRVVQLVRDLAARPLRGLRILDLGCDEGGFALELGLQDATVIAVEGRPALAEKAEFTRQALGLKRVSVVRDDPRKLSVERHGFFDVVLALGLLDRLDAPAVFEVAKRIGAVCKGFAIFESALASRARATREFEGAGFRGAPRRPARTGDDPSFLLTRDATLGLLARCGFTTVVQALDPREDPDAPCFAAFKGRRVALVTLPQSNASPLPAWPEPRVAASPRPLARILRRARR